MHTNCSMKFLTDANGVSINFRKSILFASLCPKPMPFSSSSTPPPPPSLPTSGVDVASAAATILKHHRSKSRWSHLRSLIAAGEDNRLTAAQFSQIALQLRNSPQLVIRFFHFTLHHSLSSHTLSSYATVIHILSRSRLKSQALTLIKSAMCAFSESQQQTSSIAILDALIKTYRACDSAPFVFDLLVKACLESKKIDLAIEIYAALKSKNVYLKTSTCNSLIEIVSKNRGCFAGYDLYREIFNLDAENACRNGKRENGVSPNASTLNAVMIGFYREGLVDKVEQVWDEFSRVACVPNVYSFNVLMAAYCDEGRMKEAMEVWEKMEDRDLKHDAVSYNTVIGGFCRIGEVERAEEIYREMAMKDVESTCVTYEHLINGYCKIGDLDSVKLLYKDMCRKEFSPGNSTVNVIIGSLCEKNEISAALEFWRMTEKKYDSVLEKENYKKLVKGLCEVGKLEEGLKIQAEMVVEGFEPNSDIYGAFIDGYLKQGNERMADKLREEMLCKSR